MPITIDDFETLEHARIANLSAMGWGAPLIEGKFAGGYGSGVIANQDYGLHRWNIRSDFLPDKDDYAIGDDDEPYFTYFFEFLKRHVLLGKPFILFDHRQDKSYLVRFAVNEIDFNRITAKFYSMEGVPVIEARHGDLIFNEDGSLDTDPDDGGSDCPPLADFDFSVFNPTVWVASRRITGFSDGDRINSTLNLGTAGSDFEATGDLRPSYKEEMCYPVVRAISDSTKGLALTGKTLYNVVTVSAFTIFLVYKISEVQTAGFNVAGHPSAWPVFSDFTGGVLSVGQDYSTPPGRYVGVTVYRASGGYTGVAFTASPYVVDEVMLVEVRLAGGQLSIRKNDGVAESVACGNLHATFGGVPTLFRDGGGGGLKGAFMEILAFNNDVTEEDTTDIREAFAGLYGMAV